MKIRIIENTDDSSNLGHSRGELDILVTPKEDFTVEDIEQALNTKDFYGPYLINIRDKMSVEKAIEAHFGPSHPLKRKKAQAERVFCLLPSQRLKPDQVRAVKFVAIEYGDTVIPRPEKDISADGVHPTYKGYKVLGYLTE
jgi:hypothetical protein